MKRIKPHLLRYGKGLATFLACIIISSLLHRISISDQGLLILMALVVATWFAGLGPGLMVAILIELVSWATSNRTQASTSALILSELNRVTILVIIAFLVNAGKKAETRLRDQREWLNIILSSVDEAVITTDLAGVVSFMNRSAEAMTGWRFADAAGKPLSTVFHPIENDISSDAITGVSLVSRDGTTRRIDFGVSPLRGKHERSKGSVLVFRDVTAHRQLQDQFRQAQKMEAIGQLASGVAHDFNNLLTIILGYSELAQLKTNANESVGQDLEQIKAAGVQATALVGQLLAFSRKQVLSPRVLDLNDVVADSEKMLRRLIGEDIDLICNASSEVGHVLADAGQIGQIILNLAVNARDAMPHGGKLTIETANVELDDNYTRSHAEVLPGSYVQLAISDTGHGMDAKTQSRIFEPFFTTKDLGKGTGLGLSTVFGIVRQSGGHIWLYSEPGSGTTFKIYLPRVDEPVTATEKETLSLASLQGRETLLLAEDDDAVRMLAETILKDQGYNVRVAASGTKAIEITKNTPGIALLITDLIMPGMNGSEVALAVTKLQPQTRVLYLSGYAPNAIIHQGVLNEDLDFLPKPFTPDGLARKVREVLDRPES